MYSLFYNFFLFYNNLGCNWENCVVELEQTGTPGEVDFGTLSVFGSKKHKVRIKRKSFRHDVLAQIIYPMIDSILYFTFSFRNISPCLKSLALFGILMKKLLVYLLLSELLPSHHCS